MAKESLAVEHAKHAVILTACRTDGKVRVVGSYKTQREAIEAHNALVARGARPDPRYIPETP
jgi:hypothetical protein